MNPRDILAIQDAIQAQIHVAQELLVRSREFKRNRPLQSVVPIVPSPTSSHLSSFISCDKDATSATKSSQFGFGGSQKERALSSPRRASKVSPSPTAIPTAAMTEATARVFGESTRRMNCVKVDAMLADDIDCWNGNSNEQDVSVADDDDDDDGFLSRIFASGTNTVPPPPAVAFQDSLALTKEWATSMVAADPSSHKPVTRLWQGSAVSFFLTWVDGPATK